MIKLNGISEKDIFDLAIKSHFQNDLKNAEILYKKVLDINSKNLSACNNLGIILTNLNKIKDAEKYYLKAIKINPNYADANYNIAGLYKSIGKIHDSIKYYKKTILINPNYVDAYNNIGLIHLEKSENLIAKKYFEKAIAIKPESLNALNNLGIIFDINNQFENAINCYDKVINIDKSNLNALNNAAISYSKLGKEEISIKYFLKVITTNPKNIYFLNSISDMFSKLRITSDTKINQRDLYSLLLLLFQNNNINHEDISSRVILFSLGTNEVELENLASSAYPLLDNIDLQNLFNNELFTLFLKKKLNTNLNLENLLIKIRNEIIETLFKKKENNLKDYLTFIISLSEQCWLNEYIFPKTEKEINLEKKLFQKIRNDEKINELEISILSCFSALKNSNFIYKKLKNFKSKNKLFNQLILSQIQEPLKEKNLKKTIKSYKKIINNVSRKVKLQYEENPYPRWKCCNVVISQNYIKCINDDINPIILPFNEKIYNPNVLIAGCGTGKHAIAASRYKNAKILAIDLSLSSLAYAKRKVLDLNYNNFNFLNADILEIKNLDKKFDIIESVGTLHHMENPKHGLEVLLNLLKPNGFLKIGLYSKIAREPIINFRKNLSNKRLKNKSDDITLIRKEIIDNKENEKYLKKITYSKDFYSKSNLRDLLFHEQEHQFSINEIKVIVENYKLEFLNFVITDPLIKLKYIKNFPNDIMQNSLKNWEKFENDNPNIFSGMYQFWVKKNE